MHPTPGPTNILVSKQAQLTGPLLQRWGGPLAITRGEKAGPGEQVIHGCMSDCASLRLTGWDDPNCTWRGVSPKSLTSDLLRQPGPAITLGQ